MVEPRPTKRELHDKLVHAGQQGARHAEYARSGRLGEETRQRNALEAQKDAQEVVRLQDELRSRR